MMQRQTVWIAVLWMLTGMVAAKEMVQAYELKNGLRILIKQDHRAPVVVSQLWYKVGASYETDGVTGVSHVLEHMMFKGTERFGPGEFSRIIAANGGRENAFTSRDYTAYFQILEKSRLAVSMEMEADRMRNLKLNKSEFDKELQVVIEERRMRTDDSPRALTNEHFYSVAFSNNSYKNPVIGWISDLNAMTVDDLQDWYQAWYAPNNATLVVVGAVDPKEVYKLAEKYFGQIPRQKVRSLKPRTEVPQIGLRQLKVRVPANVPYLLMGYKVPVLNTLEPAQDWEPYALEVLAGVLGGTRSSRFNKILVREQRLAVSADAAYNMHTRQSDMFMIDATPTSGKSVVEIQQAILAQIERIKTEPINAEELNRIKAQVVAHDVYQKDSMYYQAMELGILESVGLGYKRAEEYVERIRAVTAEQVKQVANKYLIEDRLTVAVLEPLPLSKEPKAAHAPLTRH